MLAIVDTGCANLASVGFAVERLGVRYVISMDAAIIQSADHVILPGVGSMPYATAQLKRRGLVKVLSNLTQPLLGICLGMQMLLDASEEGATNGLGRIKGLVTKLGASDLPTPHMGWNTLENLDDDPLLFGVNESDYVYFVHSYALPIGAHTIATTTYGQPFSAVIRSGNVYGCQFHPERSSKVGKKILENFLKVKP